MENKKRNIYNFSIPLYYFFFFGGQCLVISYMNIYLEKHLGFGGTELGLYTGITPLIPAIIIPFVGIISDRTERYKEIFLIFLGISLASAGILSLQNMLPMVLLLGALFETARASCISLADVQVTEYCAQTNKNYGLFRMGGSVGWVTFGMLIGFLTDYIPLNTLLFPAYIILVIISLLFALFFPNIKGRTTRKSTKEAASKKTSTENPIIALLHNRAYVVMLLFSVIVCMTGEACLSYSSNHLVSTLNSPESIIGLNTAFNVVPEFLFFPAIAWFLKKFGFKKMYIAATIGAILRFGIYFLADNPYVFLLGSLFHCLGSGAYCAVNLAFMHKKVDASMFGTAVTLMGTVATIARSIYGYCFGYIYDSLGSRYIFLSVLPLFVLLLVYLIKTRLFDEKAVETTT